MERDPDAFVVWLDGPAPEPTRPAGLRGRVEHVQSSARAPFRNTEELVRFLEEHRRRERAGEDPG
jgi:hypothetical protein